MGNFLGPGGRGRCFILRLRWQVLVKMKAGMRKKRQEYSDGTSCCANSICINSWKGTIGWDLVRLNSGLLLGELLNARSSVSTWKASWKWSVAKLDIGLGGTKITGRPFWHYCKESAGRFPWKKLDSTRFSARTEASSSWALHSRSRTDHITTGPCVFCILSGLGPWCRRQMWLLTTTPGT